MSEFKVCLTEILSITPHTNAERLEIATVYGFQVVVRKDAYKAGDRVLYIPIDAILPRDLESFLFPVDAKIKLHRSRVKQIRIRQFASQGMLIDPKDVEAVYKFLPDVLEHDYMDVLSITKFEPPETFISTPSGKTKVKRQDNPYFEKYNGLDNIKWFPDFFKDKDVQITEKIHGTNARAGIVPFVPYTWWEKLKGLFNLNPKYEFCYGSNNVQLQSRRKYKGFYEANVYESVFKAMDVQSKLKPDEIIYGEIYGDGVQKGYNYGLTNERKFVLFDVKRIVRAEGKPDYTIFLSPDEVKIFAKERGFDVVPELYRGLFNYDDVKKLTIGNSVLCSDQKVREGVVVKLINNDDKKAALKMLSEEYLDNNDNTDFH